MELKLFKQLLAEGESARLDYKSQQYPLIGASDDQKSELLKDILSMANAWREVDAFVLIGVQEEKGKVARVLGIQNHLDDASSSSLSIRKRIGRFSSPTQNSTLKDTQWRRFAFRCSAVRSFCSSHTAPSVRMSRMSGAAVRRISQIPMKCFAWEKQPCRLPGFRNSRLSSRSWLSERRLVGKLKARAWSWNRSRTTNCRK